MKFKKIDVVVPQKAIDDYVLASKAMNEFQYKTEEHERFRRLHKKLTVSAITLADEVIDRNNNE